MSCSTSTHGFVIPSISGFYEMPSSKETPTDFRSYAALIPPPPLYGANLGSIFTSNNPQTPGKDKHMQVRFFKRRGNVKNGQLKIKLIGTKDDVSDVFTKALLRTERDSNGRSRDLTRSALSAL